MKYDALKDSGHNSDYRGKYNPLSLISNIAKAITYSYEITLRTSAKGVDKSATFNGTVAK